MYESFRLLSWLGRSWDNHVSNPRPVSCELHLSRRGEISVVMTTRRAPRQRLRPALIVCFPFAFTGDNVEVSPVLEEAEEEEEAQAKELSSQLTSLSTQPSVSVAAASASSPPPPQAPPRPSLSNGAELPPAGFAADPFGAPPRPQRPPPPPSTAGAAIFDPFATAPAPFAPPAPVVSPPAATYHAQSGTNPFATAAAAAATTSNPWAAAPSPWAPPPPPPPVVAAPAPRLLGVDRRDGSGDPFDVAWAERQASARESSTNPFVARGLPAASASSSAAGPADKGFRVGV